MNQNRFLIPLVAIFITLGLVVYISNRSMPVVVEKRLANLPHTIGLWEGNDFSFDQYVIDELDTDESVARNYINRNNDYTVTLYIGYYGTRKGGRTAHNPNACYPSSGWDIKSDTSFNITDGFGNVNRMLVQKGEMSQIVYHWYQSGSKVVQGGIDQNINRFINKIRYNRDDGAFVRISIDGRAEDVEDALIQFGKLIIPHIAKNWPVEE
ncbi:MAG: EpsI family protein [Candidatus Brocadiaceae bacterium]|nr:EpsI family protein [Candidatus Brocadiaceae bacterium]